MFFFFFQAEDGIRDFCLSRGLGDVYKRQLYLFTVADVRGTSPKVWNAWKGKLLEDLFRATRRVLTGQPLARDAALAEKQAEAVRLLRLYALDESVKDRLWSQLDTTYFLRHDAQEIAWQTRNLHQKIAAEQPV